MSPSHPLDATRPIKEAQIAANRRARVLGDPLPFPNPWDSWDPTKVSPEAAPEEIHRSYLEFLKRCPPPKKTRHTL